MTIIEFERRAEYQNGYDREFENWKVIDVHQIPAKLNENHEIDFYCCNGKKVYLLRLRHRKEEAFKICDKSKHLGYPAYLIAELPICKVDNGLIKNILNIFNLK